MVEALAEHLCIKPAYRGVALVDSTCLPVCSIQRECDHKCVKGHASKGCDSLGWLYGFKLHLITSDTGETLRFWLSTGKTHDTAPLFQHDFLRGREGLLQARWRVELTPSKLKKNLGLRVSRSCKGLGTFKPRPAARSSRTRRPVPLDFLSRIGGWCPLALTQYLPNRH